MGALVALIDHAASAVDCKLNKTIFKFLQIRHIPTVIAVILAISAFIYYGLNRDKLIYAISILWVAFGFLAVVVVCDVIIIFLSKRK